MYEVIELITGFAQSLKVLESLREKKKLFKALKVCENWVGSVKVCEICGLQSARGKWSAYQSETTFPKTEQLKIILKIAVWNHKERTSYQFCLIKCVGH